MTIAQLAGPVFARVMPTAFAVLLAIVVIALLPVVIPRAVRWLQDGDPEHATAHSGGHPAEHHASHGRHPAAHHSPVHHHDEVLHRL